MSRQLNICLILSGSVAAYKACELASRLTKAGHSVQCVASEGALRFVGAVSLEALTGRPVHTDLWAKRENMAHISLRRWADLFLFYPATGNRINAMAAGLAPDLIGAIFLANNFEKPFWIAPAMNSNMLAHPATQAGLERLRAWGCRILEGTSGRMACGDEGIGRLAEPEYMFSQIQEFAGDTSELSLANDASAAASETKPRLLLTGGAMSEPIDAVRAITNTSSGKTATTIATAFLAAGWQVDFLCHDSIRESDLGSVGRHQLGKCERYHAFGDFSEKLGLLLASHAYDAVIHAAAVSDYHVASVIGGESAAGSGKLESQASIHVRLEPNPKLLPTIRPRVKAGASGHTAIVAFKLTVDATENEGQGRCAKFFADNQADFAVWNDLSGIRDQAHPFVLFHPSGVFSRGKDNGELAASLLAAVSQTPSQSPQGNANAQ